jgi:K+-sensing histidine kinase KdpD
VDDDRDPRPRVRTAISPVAWLVALAGPVVVSLALIPLRGEVRPSNASLVLVLVVVVAALLGGRIGGVTAALVSTAAFDFFFTRPYSSFTIDSRDDVETALLLLVVGLVVGELVVRTHRSERRSALDRAEVAHVRRVSELAAGGEPAGRLIGIVQTELAQLLPVSGCRFEPPPFSTELPVLTHQGVRVPATERDDTATGRVALPVYGAGRPVGRFVLHLRDGSTGITIPTNDRALAIALADQLGVVLGDAVSS